MIALIRSLNIDWRITMTDLVFYIEEFTIDKICRWFYQESCM